MTKTELIFKEKEIREKGKKDGINHFSSGIAVMKEDRILIIKRSIDDFLGGNYELPGGEIEDGETFFDGVTRELKEETGLNLKCISLLFEGFDYNTETKNRVIQVNFLVTTDTYEITLSHEHESFLWVGIDGINNLTMTEEMRKCIREAIHIAINN